MPSVVISSLLDHSVSKHWKKHGSQAARLKQPARPSRVIKREGQLWIRIFPDKPVTKKPAEVRMGKGKGAPEYFVARINPGRILFEIEGVPMEIAKESLRLGAQKLPVQTKTVMRKDYVEEAI